MDEAIAHWRQSLTYGGSDGALGQRVPTSHLRFGCGLSGTSGGARGDHNEHREHATTFSGSGLRRLMPTHANSFVGGTSCHWASPFDCSRSNEGGVMARGQRWG